MLVIITSVGNQFIGQVLTKELIVTALKKMGMKKIKEKEIVKFIPVLGAAIAGSISYGAMYQLGKNHVEECFEICERLLEEVKK